MTSRRSQVLDYLREYIASHGYAPTMDEIGGALGIKSSNTVTYHLLKLEHDGLIIRTKVNRGITLVGSSVARKTKRVPISNDTRARILDFMHAYVAKHSYPPSMREIADCVGVVLSTVPFHLRVLERSGYVKHVPTKSRSYIPTEKSA